MAQQILQFISHHGLLVGGFILVLIIALLYELRLKVNGVQQVDPQQAIQAINRDEAVVVDIRAAELFKSGHIISAINIPLADIAQQSKKLAKYKTKPVIVVCALGQTASKAAQYLQQEGYASPRILRGGMNAWQGAGLPLVKGA